MRVLILGGTGAMGELLILSWPSIVMRYLLHHVIFINPMEMYIICKEMHIIIISVGGPKRQV